jgi:hypothetical protein
MKKQQIDIQIEMHESILKLYNLAKENGAIFDFKTQESIIGHEIDLQFWLKFKSQQD